MLSNVQSMNTAKWKTNQVPALRACILIGELEREGAGVDNKQINVACYVVTSATEKNKTSQGIMVVWVEWGKWRGIAISYRVVSSCF